MNSVVAFDVGITWISDLIRICLYRFQMMFDSREDFERILPTIMMNDIEFFFNKRACTVIYY
jgi:hypothetical protein